VLISPYFAIVLHSIFFHFWYIKTIYMKKILAIVLSAFICSLTNAQSVGIGTPSPNASAQLEVSSTTKGLLIPRMTGAQRAAIPSAAAGLMEIQKPHLLHRLVFIYGNRWAQAWYGEGLPERMKFLEAPAPGQSMAQISTVM
jgi:hypothetical protein